MKTIYYGFIFALAGAAMVPIPAFAQSCIELGNCVWNTSNPLENFATPFTDVYGTVLFPIIIYGLGLTLILFRTKSHAITSGIGLVYLSFIDPNALGAWGSVVYWGVAFVAFSVGAVFVSIFKKASAESW